jgi:(2Fe-2S) ferredoxin
MQNEAARIEQGFAKMGLAGAQRHAFLCIGPDCCAAAAGQAVWETLKSTLKQLDLPVMRTKAACFRVCHGGPWLVVYPEGVWYGGLTPERVARIASEHLNAGRPVAEWVVRVQPLGAAADDKES